MLKRGANRFSIDLNLDDRYTLARVVELADTLDLGSSAFGYEGSSPSSRTLATRRGLLAGIAQR